MVRAMDGLELVLRATRAELWAEERGGTRLALPRAFWQAVSGHLRAAGYPELAAAIDQAVAATQAREKTLAEKLQCMDPTYDEKAQARCQALLAEDLQPEHPTS